jgi:TonB family protein
MRPLRSLAPILLAVGVAVAGAAPLPAQEEPLAAGSEGIPVPKKTKHVQPTYPQEALAQGVRGIVILDIVVDTQGKVESTNVVRSVPGLDEAAIAAARQWGYEPTKVDGKPVRVRITVPITFALALPQLARQDGVPELRQGVTPAWPPGAEGGGRAAAEVTLEPDGRVGGAQVLEGAAPWSGALLAALRTWRFAPPPDDAVLSFRVEADFVAGGSAPQQRKVTLKATGLQRSGLLDEPASPASAPAVPPTATAAVTAVPPPATTAEPAPASPVPTGPTTAEVPRPVVPPVAPPVALPVSPPDATASRTSAPAPVAQAPTERPGPPVATTPAATPPLSSAPAAGATAAPPPVEVITAPPPAAAPENGVSAIRDVTLEPGVPDLTRGRRPVVPPLARMAGTSGTVEVSFSVSAAGTTSILSATGPDLLRPAAEQAVASWVFRRARADRAYLVAVFTSAEDKGTAVVRPQAPPPAAPSAAPAPTTPPATPDTPKAPPQP